MQEGEATTCNDKIIQRQTWCHTHFPMSKGIFHNFLRTHVIFCNFWRTQMFLSVHEFCVHEFGNCFQCERA